MTTTAAMPGRIRLGVTAAIIAALVLMSAATAAFGAEFEGPVLSKDKQAQTFRMNPENHDNVTIKVNDGTKYQRLGGFGDIHRGLKVDVNAVRQNGHWVANKVEKKR